MEGQTGHGQGENNPDVDTKEVALESAIDKFGGCWFGDNSPHPMAQFATDFLEFEDDPVMDEGKSAVTPTSNIRSAYNAWAQINLHQLSKETDRSPDDVDLKTHAPGGAVSKISPDPPSERITLDEGRKHVWFGVSLTDRGDELVELEDKFPLDE